LGNTSGTEEKSELEKDCFWESDENRKKHKNKYLGGRLRQKKAMRDNFRY
jgi:hypothetical protein